MATNPAGGSAYGDLTGARQFINKKAIKGVHLSGPNKKTAATLTGLTQAAANAATGDYTVADLIDLINTAIATSSATTSTSMGLASR